MTYRDFLEAAVFTAAADDSISVSVETWRHVRPDGSVSYSNTFGIWSAKHKEHCKAKTPDESLDMFRKLCSERAKNDEEKSQSSEKVREEVGELPT